MDHSVLLNPGDTIVRVKVGDLIHLLESAGWRLKATKGSHRQFRHPGKGMAVTVPVLRSAGLDKEKDDE